MDFLAIILLFIGTMSLVSAFLIGFFPSMYRNRQTGELPDRKRWVLFSISLGCTCFLAVILITEYFL